MRVMSASSDSGEPPLQVLKCPKNGAERLADAGESMRNCNI
jgi:hypothetical protein